MKKLLILASAILAFSASNSTVAQTKVSELTEYEKIALLYGFCREINDFDWPTKNDDGVLYRDIFDFKNLHDVNSLLFDIWEPKDNDDLWRIADKAESDFKKKLVLGEFTLTQEVIDRCIADGKKVISEKYIDNFDYMN